MISGIIPRLPEPFRDINGTDQDSRSMPAQACDCVRFWKRLPANVLTFLPDNTQPFGKGSNLLPSMSPPIAGLHHVTAIATDPQRNLDFYAGLLGLRLVKKTVNFDDPGTYHFYYGNENGTPGTILTFFPWTHVKPGRIGTGMATDIGYAVPTGSLDFWSDHFEKHQVRFGQKDEQFGEQILRFEDPDGLRLQLVEPKKADNRTPWITGEVGKDAAIKGFHSIVLTLRNIKPTASILTDIFGYKLLQQDGNR